MGAAAALAEQDLPNDAIAFASGAELDVDSLEVFRGGIDLTDSFSQFCDDDLVEDFGFDYPEVASVYGCSHVCEDGFFVPVQPDDMVFPVFHGLCMGWFWAMWAVHSTVEHLCLEKVGFGPRALRLCGVYLGAMENDISLSTRS